MTWQPDSEKMDREELEQLQLERLESTISRVYRNVPFYRKRFDEIGFDPDDLRSLADLRRLPFTGKRDFRDNHPYGLFAVPLRDVVRVHASSGTTGLATAVGYTRNDLKTWADLTARVLVAGGVGKDDVVQVAFDYGLFTGAFGLHHGAERIGASVIPVSSANAMRQIQIMRDYRSTALVTTPSHALALADAMIEAQVNRSALSLQYGLFGAEPWSESMRGELQEKLRVVATDNYGLSEVMGPGLAGECLERSGLHVAEDHFLVEVIDPETLEPLPNGQVGELVVTTLTREALPVIRFRTRDLTSISREPCPCGRTLARMSRVKGRTDDLLLVKGARVFPSEIEAVLLEIEGTAPHYQIILDRKSGEDLATVVVEASPDGAKALSRPALQGAIERRLAAELGVSVAVELVDARTIERSEGKARRVIDRRVP
jgi:phenylacetate-CoA ligase